MNWPIRALSGFHFYIVPWLEAATDEQRSDYRLDPISIYWEQLDEGINIVDIVSGSYKLPGASPEQSSAGLNGRNLT